MRLGLVAGLLLLSPLSQAADKPTFADYVGEVRQEARQQGFPDALLDKAFANVFYREKVVSADRNQPETRITLDTYLQTRVPDWKVKQAQDLLRTHQDLLNQVSQTYGVQPRFIVALWGNESNFGRIQGKNPVISALLTLAYDGRREALFKKELFAALSILQQGHVPVDELLGSWAGAMGQSQFLPTSFLAYAQDFDGDGKKDIWQNHADVFASIANYLAQSGWNGSYTWGRQVQLPANFDVELAGLDKAKMQQLDAWQQLGVRRYDGDDLPTVNIPASLILPDGPNGRAYLVYSNFHTLMRWNRSTYFGVSVSHLADRIRFSE